MPDLLETWKAALPKVQNSVSGRGVWAALNAARPVAMEGATYVIGLPHEDSELAGHLRMPSTKRLIEIAISQVAGTQLAVRIIEGVTAEDYELVKRRDIERRRLEDAELVKMRAQLAAKTSWEGVYEQLSRRYAAVANKSLPQNRARFFEEAIELIAEARKGQTAYDDIGERNFARCLERVAQYSEVPSTLVAMYVLQRSGEL